MPSMKPLRNAFGVSAHVLKSCSKAAVAVSHFVVSKVIGAGGSVTIQSLLLATNAWILYAGMFPAYIFPCPSTFWPGATCNYRTESHYAYKVTSTFRGFLSDAVFHVQA